MGLRLPVISLPQIYSGVVKENLDSEAYLVCVTLGAALVYGGISVGKTGDSIWLDHFKHELITARGGRDRQCHIV